MSAVDAAVLAAADRIYAVAPEEFVAARDRAARDGADKQSAATVRKLRKPSVSAWAINLLVRREAARIDDALALAESLREAAESLDGQELRTLTRQRRQLTAALTTSARSHARESGVRLTSTTADQVEGMLNAAMLDPVAAQVLRTGRVLKAFTSTGMSELDVTEVVALPEALDVTAEPVETPEPVRLSVLQGGRAELEEANEAAEDAAASVAQAETEVAEAAGSVDELNARRLQLQVEIDELRRKVAALEEQVDEVDDELEVATTAQQEAEAILAEARATQARARKRVEQLDR